MSLRLILVVDQEESQELVGLLAKAMGRGELGIMDFRLERFEEPRLRSQPQPQPKPIAAPRVKAHRRRRTIAGDGGGRFKATRHLFEAGPVQFNEFRKGLAEAGFSDTGAGGALKQWIGLGLIRKIGGGRYALAEQGA